MQAKIIREFHITALQCQHWRSSAKCAAALELPNLNYVHGELTLELKPKDKYCVKQKRAKAGKKSLQLQTLNHR